jgi:PTH1 family peptidyl-tRNA hydrolase
MKIFLGLGNPGARYAKNFHNLGFMAVDELAGRYSVKIDKKRCRALAGEFFSGGEKIVLAKPQTFMNLSGESARELLGKYGAEPAELFVLYDDADLDRAALRVRRSGSAGTHNGMRNLVECLGGTEFPRIRIGIGRPPRAGTPIADYVLSDIPKDMRDEMAGAVRLAADAAQDFIGGASFDEVMRKYNTPPAAGGGVL